MIKQWIKSWLEISSKPPPERITKTELRAEVSDALQFIFRGKPHFPGWSEYIEPSGAQFEELLRRIIKAQVKEETVLIFDARINNEAFIDELVERIKRKQL